MTPSATSGVAVARKRVLSGMRPTGRLHIGHYFGALDNWVKLQKDPAYECFFFVADWHALTSDYADTSGVAQNTIDIGIDWLAAGLDPVKCTLFVQSQVPEHAELHLLLSMVTPLGWLERVPTYKEALDNITDKDLHTYGFLGYPLLQTADIVMYGAPGSELFVPVGEDQAPHVEMSREVVLMFNAYFGIEIAPEFFDDLSMVTFNEERLRQDMKNPFLHGVAKAALDAGGKYSEQQKLFLTRAIKAHIRSVGFENFGTAVGAAAKYFAARQPLVAPEVLLTATPRIPGTDGRKMSKSYGNAIMLSEDDASIRTKARAMMTDPARKRRQDPGNPDVCPVFSWHKLFSPQGTIDRVNRECRTAEIGCVDCKGLMADQLIKWIEPVRARRQEYEAHPARVLEILAAGSKKARQVAQQTMARVREAIFGSDVLRKEILGAAGAGKPSAARG